MHLSGTSEWEQEKQREGDREPQVLRDLRELDLQDAKAFPPGMARYSTVPKMLSDNWQSAFSVIVAACAHCNVHTKQQSMDGRLSHAESAVDMAAMSMTRS